MSIEEWGGIDDADGQSGVSESTAESRERAAQASKRRTAAVKALQKQEQKARKQEGSLIKILIQFIQKQDQRDITNIIVKLLDQNIPAQFILSMLMLVFTEIRPIMLGQEEFTKDTKLALTGPSIADMEQALLAVDVKEFHAETLPPQAKIDLNQWIKEVRDISEQQREIILERVFRGNHVNSTAIRLMMVVMERYLVGHKIKGHHQRLGDFCTFVLQGIMKYLKESAPQKLSESDPDTTL